MRATIIDANGECFDLGDIEITAETTLNDLASGRDIAMPAVLVYSDSGAPNFTDTPAPTRQGPFLWPDEADRFPASTLHPSSIITVTSGGMTPRLRDDGAMMVRLQDVCRAEHQYHFPEHPKGWPDPNRLGARKTRRGHCR